MFGPARLPQRGGLLLIATCAALLATGCQTLSPTLVACPLPVVEQSAKIQKIVPLGTPRDEAIAKLKDAGIEGVFSTAKTMFYCETWKQSETERWHIDVALLFDENGELYALRPDPKSGPNDTVGTAEIKKPPKQVAAGPKPSVEDPFAE